MVGLPRGALAHKQGLHADMDAEATNDLNSKRDEIRTKSLEGAISMLVD
jgi:hypothetical protein